jgi:hypothetical protein
MGMQPEIWPGFSMTRTAAKKPQSMGRGITPQRFFVAAAQF